MRKVAIALAIVPGAMIAVSAPSFAQVDVTGDVNVDVDAGVGVTADVAPPPLPEYTQPPCPQPGYLWTPGYWAYNAGYYWVPGVWAAPPAVGLLWTPPYWGFAGGVYGFHAGYWGPHVGFYGGINYGFGFAGVGFVGGFWSGGAFQYNTAFANVNTNVIHNTYVNNTNITNNYNHTSYNGGPGGIQAQPSPQQLAAANQRQYGPTADQRSGIAAAQADHGNYASANGGRPENPAFATNRSGFGYGNEVNTRQGNQQSRIEQGIRNGSIAPGGAENLENREDSIHNQAQSDRAANGGYLTPQERQQINQRQNNVSNSIYNDRHNGYNDNTAAARYGTTPQQQRRAAQQIHNQQRPRGPHAQPHPQERP